MNEMNKKIEEILRNSGFYSTMETEWNEDVVAEELKDITEKLSTLYTEMVEGELQKEVWKFADWCDSLSFQYQDSEDNAMVMEELVKQYLLERNKE